MTIDKNIDDSSHRFMLLYHKNISAAMTEIQQLLFSVKKDEYGHMEQDLYEQIRKIIQRYEKLGYVGGYQFKCVYSDNGVNNSASGQF